MGENFNTILTGKVRPILILQPHLGKIVFPSFVNVLLKQIKHSLSLLFSLAVRAQQASLDNKPWCSTHKSELNSKQNQS